MQQALANCVRPQRAQRLLNTSVKHGRHRAFADGRCRHRLSLAKRVQYNADALTLVDSDGPRTARRSRGHHARSRRRDVARLVGKGSM